MMCSFIVLSISQRTGEESLADAEEGVDEVHREHAHNAHGARHLPRCGRREETRPGEYQLRSVGMTRRVFRRETDASSSAHRHRHREGPEAAAHEGVHEVLGGGADAVG